ncbi:helix-turn-helix transcriptional regulator [Bifidobacterium sp. SO1]|nr:MULTISPECIES: helix-turn-helix transcriptional regulator [Bifidobacterium]
MQRSGMNAAQLAHATGLSESLISRALNGRIDPAFGKITTAAEHLGYQITLSPLEQVTLDMCGLRMEDLIKTINSYAGRDNADSWPPISASMRELLESSSASPAHALEDLSTVLKRLPNKEWRAFMAGLYRQQHWPNAHGLAESDLRLPVQWTPLRKIYRSATQPDPDFLAYNVYLPQGELQWK